MVLHKKIKNTEEQKMLEEVLLCVKSFLDFFVSEYNRNKTK